MGLKGYLNAASWGQDHLAKSCPICHEDQMFSQSVMHIDEYHGDEDRGKEERQNNKIVVSLQGVSSSPSR